MMPHRIFNLEHGSEVFQLAGYEFTRVPEYAGRVAQLPQRGQVTSGALHLPNGEPYWVKTREDRQGTNQHTFSAHWVEAGAEPAALLTMDAPLIADVLLLLTLWGDRLLSASQIEPARSPYYWPQAYLPDSAERLRMVELAIRELRNRGVPKTVVHPVIQLLVEADRHEMVQVKTLVLSPVLDVMAGATPAEWRDAWTAEQQGLLETTKKALKAVLLGVDPGLERAVQPFLSDVSRLGAPRAADQLSAYLRWALDWADVPVEVIASHARAVNVVRNAVVHRAASPEKIEVKFRRRPPIVIPRGAPANDLMRAAIYLPIVMHTIMKRHVTALLGMDARALGDDADIAGFFETGVFHGQNVLEEWFKDRVLRPDL